MDILSLRAAIKQAQIYLSEITSQLDSVSNAELETLSAILTPLLERLEVASSGSLPPLYDLTIDQYQAILDIVSAGILVYDRHRVIRYTNMQMMEYLGYNPTGENRDRFLEKIRMTDWDGRPISMNERLTTQVWDGIFVSDVPMMITNKFGQVHQVLVSGIPLFQGGKFSGVVVIWNDVTRLNQATLEIKLREEQLRESEGRFRIALANTSIYVFTFDRDLRCTWLYGPGESGSSQRSPEKRYKALLTDEGMLEMEQLQHQVIETGIGIRKEVHLLHQGVMRVLDIRYEPIQNSTGQVIGLTGAAIDITEQRHLEATQNEYAARIQLYHRLTEEHEKNLLALSNKILDGPLQNAISLITDIQFVHEIATNDQVVQVTSEIERRAKALADELRAVCRELNPPSVTQFGLKRAIQSHILNQQNQNPGIEFRLEMMEDLFKLPDPIGIALFRIYCEAIQNAVHHGAPTRISVRMALTRNQITMEIEDNGIGFTPTENWMELVQNGQFGLVNMKEQADSIHAILTLGSSPGNGALVRVTVALVE